jgi:hypothetical protein
VCVVEVDVARDAVVLHGGAAGRSAAAAHVGVRVVSCVHVTSSLKKRQRYKRGKGAQACRRRRRQVEQHRQFRYRQICKFS